MKKVRFFSVAVAVIAALFVSVWAGSTTHPLGTLNGIIATGQKTGETSMSCRTLSGGSANLTSPITAVKGLVDVNQYCKPTTSCKVLVYRQSGGLTLIGSVSVPCGSNFSGYTIPIASNTHPANGTYCVSAEVTLLNPAPQGIICGISYTNGSVTYNW